MSKGKSWKQGYRKDHAHHYNWKYKVTGGRYGHKRNTKWYFRKYFKKQFKEISHIGFSKLSNIEKYYWN